MVRQPAAGSKRAGNADSPLGCPPSAFSHCANSSVRAL